MGFTFPPVVKNYLVVIPHVVLVVVRVVNKRYLSDPYAGVTSGRCAREFLVPNANHSVEIKRTILEIPVASCENLHRDTQRSMSRIEGLGFP
jgi:hypothetical protein